MNALQGERRLSGVGRNVQSDDGFDPEMGYLEVLSEARDCVAKCRPFDSASSRSSSVCKTEIEADFTSDFDPWQWQKSVQDSRSTQSWKNSLFFWRRFKKKTNTAQQKNHRQYYHHHHHQYDQQQQKQVSTAWSRSSVSAPLSSAGSHSSGPPTKKAKSGQIYSIEFSPSPYPRTSRPASGPPSGCATPISDVASFDLPYFQLLRSASPARRISTGSRAAPLYIVT